MALNTVPRREVLSVLENSLKGLGKHPKDLGRDSPYAQFLMSHWGVYALMVVLWTKCLVESE